MQLRAALAGPVRALLQGDIVTMTVRALRCRVGLHDWRSAYTREGEQCQSCARCGKERLERIRNIPLPSDPPDMDYPGRGW